MKIIITGYQGFIGKHLKLKYQADGHIIWGWRSNGLVDQNEKLIKASLMETNEIVEALNQIYPDVIIHCAGSADVAKSVEFPDVDMQKNYITTHNILFAMKQLNLKNTRFVLLSSAAVYGNPLTLPIKENDRIMPLSPYALHKQAAEDVCFFMSSNYGFDIKVLRIFSAFGPGLKKQIFWDMYQKVKQNNKLEMFGSGYESRDYIYINDVVNAINIIVNNAPRDEVLYNVANGEEVEIREVAKIFMMLLGLDEGYISFNGTRREGDPINWKADISKLASLGYTKSVSFCDGVKGYIDWLKKEGY